LTRRDSADPTSGEKFPNQVATINEAGFKVDILENRVVGTVSYFDTKQKNVVISVHDPVTGLSNLVPVGQDQKQHIEITRDIAVKFNEQYGQTFIIPEPQIRQDVAKVPGIDGEKMSKSYGNAVEIFGDEKALRKKIMAIKMDSRTPQEPKQDADQNLAIQLLKLVAPANVAADIESRLRAGGLGYGDLKKTLFEHYWSYFAAARAKRSELAANLDFVQQVLSDGAAKARALAQVVLERAKVNSGLR